MLRLLRCMFWKSGPWRRSSMAPSFSPGSSILMTLAPQSASWRTAVGPERARVRSRTVKRASGPLRGFAAISTSSGSHAGRCAPAVIEFDVLPLLQRPQVLQQRGGAGLAQHWRGELDELAVELLVRKRQLRITLARFLEVGELAPVRSLDLDARRALAREIA